MLMKLSNEKLLWRKEEREVAMKKRKNEPESVIANRTNGPIEWERLIAAFNGGTKYVEYGANRIIFSQGDPADSVFFIRKGKVKVSVTSSQGKEAIVAILANGDFFGEGCLAGQLLRIASAYTLTDCSLARIHKALMARMLHERHGVSELFATHLLSRNIRFEGDLVDQLFNSSEKRLARTLLLLADFGKESKSESVHPRINQEDLAQMVGTTRSRISHFMNKFRTLGFVDYSDHRGLTVNSGLLSVVLND
jgi:CRP/FNR family transcriptional regulator, cyclic AMP receptor protein